MPRCRGSSLASCEREHTVLVPSIGRLCAWPSHQLAGKWQQLGVCWPLAPHVADFAAAFSFQGSPTLEQAAPLRGTFHIPTFEVRALGGARGLLRPLVGTSLCPVATMARRCFSTACLLWRTALCIDSCAQAAQRASVKRCHGLSLTPVPASKPTSADVLWIAWPLDWQHACVNSRACAFQSAQ
jgi:hypothetical protein